MPPHHFVYTYVTKEINILRYLLEALDAARDAARHTWPIPRAAYPFIVQIMLSDTRLGSIQRQKEYDSKGVGCPNGWARGGYGEREFFGHWLSFY